MISDDNSSSPTDQTPQSFDVEIEATPRPRPKVHHSIVDVDPPRFSIAHLMLWIACTALYLSIIRILVQSGPGLAELPLVSIVLLLLHAIGAGAAGAGTLVFLVRRLRRVNWPIEPGEWLLFIVGTQLPLDLLALYLIISLDEIFSSTHYVSWALSCGVLIFPTFSRKLPNRWRALFCLLILIYSWPLVVTCGQMWFGWEFSGVSGMTTFIARNKYWLAMLLVVVLVVWDKSQHVRYGWLGWTGVALWFYEPTLRIVLFFM